MNKEWNTGLYRVVQTRIFYLFVHHMGETVHRVGDGVHSVVDRMVDAAHRTIGRPAHVLLGRGDHHSDHRAGHQTYAHTAGKSTTHYRKASFRLSVIILPRKNKKSVAKICVFFYNID